MRIPGLAATLVATFALAGPLAAQQPKSAPSKAHATAPDMMMHMQAMDSADARLDNAVARMNQSTGDARNAAMADVLNALVAEQKMMHAHMRQMGGMGEMGKMGEMRGMGGMGAGHKMPAHPMPGMAHPDSSARPHK
ncbi:MAG: hypothetical protein ABI637_08765 [Gemmatimonadota bacterium]